jgi:hypothetical protein
MEFLYTRQQMEGFKGYQSKVKIGNWSEDMELEAAKLKNYLMKKERGMLQCSQVGSPAIRPSACPCAVCPVRFARPVPRHRVIRPLTAPARPAAAELPLHYLSVLAATSHVAGPDPEWIMPPLLEHASFVAAPFAPLGTNLAVAMSRRRSVSRMPCRRWRSSQPTTTATCTLATR